MTASEIRQPWTGPLAKPGRKPKRRREGDDIRYRRAIKQLPCCVCFNPPPNDPHHLKRGTNDRGMGMRSSDRWAVPLCRFPAKNNCHDKVEVSDELDWFFKRGIRDPLDLANRMWAAWNREHSIEALLFAMRPDPAECPVRAMKWKLVSGTMTPQDWITAQAMADHGQLPGWSVRAHAMVHIGHDPLADQYDYDDKDPLDMWRS